MANETKKNTILRIDRTEIFMKVNSDRSEIQFMQMDLRISVLVKNFVECLDLNSPLACVGYVEDQRGAITLGMCTPCCLRSVWITLRMYAYNKFENLFYI